jgi:hypothetical protein
VGLCVRLYVPVVAFLLMEESLVEDQVLAVSVAVLGVPAVGGPVVRFPLGAAVLVGDATHGVLSLRILMALQVVMAANLGKPAPATMWSYPGGALPGWQPCRRSRREGTSTSPTRVHIGETESIS